MPLYLLPGDGTWIRFIRNLTQLPSQATEPVKAQPVEPPFNGPFTVSPPSRVLAGVPFHVPVGARQYQAPNYIGAEGLVKRVHAIERNSGDLRLAFYYLDAGCEPILRFEGPQVATGYAMEAMIIARDHHHIHYELEMPIITFLYQKLGETDMALGWLESIEGMAAGSKDPHQSDFVYEILVQTYANLSLLEDAERIALKIKDVDLRFAKLRSLIELHFIQEDEDKVCALLKGSLLKTAQSNPNGDIQCEHILQIGEALLMLEKPFAAAEVVEDLWERKRHARTEFNRPLFGYQGRNDLDFERVARILIAAERNDEVLQFILDRTLRTADYVKPSALKHAVEITHPALLNLLFPDAHSDEHERIVVRDSPEVATA